MDQSPLRRTSLVRVYSFAARHHYGRKDRSDAWNRERFGAQAEPHEHRYRLEIAVGGRADPDTGFVVDLNALDEAVVPVVEGLEGSDLNRAVPEVRAGRMQPSTEALANWFWERIEGRLPKGVQLRRVRVWESDRLGAEVERPSSEP